MKQLTPWGAKLGLALTLHQSKQSHVSPVYLCRQGEREALAEEGVAGTLS